MTDLEIDGLHLQWTESKAQISCAVHTAYLLLCFALSWFSHDEANVFGSNFIIVSCLKKSNFLL